MKRPTLIVREVMRMCGAPSYAIYTNKYEKCRTVKCYMRHLSDSLADFRADLEAAMRKNGTPEYSVKVHSHDFGRWGTVKALIVRIPL